MAPGKHSSVAAANEHEGKVKGLEIFVGGLGRTVTESTIREVFSSCGEIVEIRMMKDQNGISKGFCFVRFAKKESAFKAQREKNGYMLQGKKIGVAPSQDQDSLFLGNLRKDWSFEEFNKIVRQAFQDVVSVDLAMPSSTDDSPVGKKRQNRGFAFVQFSSHAAAARAYRAGSKPDFLLGDNWRPAVDWAENEPEIDPEELAKIKTAFVGNLPTNANEEYLKKLFAPLGKLERVALSRKGHFPVGFIHFAKRSDLDNAIKEMDGKTVQGPEKGPKFMLQVSVAKPVDKDRKRAYSDSQDKSVSKSGSWTKSSKDSQTHDYSDGRKSKAPRLQYSTEEPVVADPYEAAVVSLPSAVTERLLRIFRLGIATRYDIDIQGITSLKELPESAAIAVLDQFMLSGADGRNKGKYFTGLLARHRDRLELNRSTLPPPRRTRDYLSRGSELPSLPVRAHMPAFDPSISRQSAGILSAKYDGYTASPGSFPYSPSILDDPHVPRTGLGKLGETGSSYRPRVPSVGYGSGVRSDAHLAVRSERSGERPQVKFDPFTGKPYKFDPFTGEPIQPETPPRGFGSLF